MKICSATEMGTKTKTKILFINFLTNFVNFEVQVRNVWLSLVNFVQKAVFLLLILELKIVIYLFAKKKQFNVNILNKSLNSLAEKALF